MKRIVLKRISQTADGTWGVLEYNGEPFALSGELPWNKNKKNISCIPPGSYTVKSRYSTKYGSVYELQSVPNRGGILIHAGNVPTKDSKGCIIVGEEFSRLDKSLAVLSSKRALAELLSYIDGDPVFTIDILNYCG